MDCMIMNWATREQTHTNESGVEVCQDTRLIRMSVEGFAEVYTKERGGDYYDNLDKFSTSGYDEDCVTRSNRIEGKLPAQTFNIRTRGKGVRKQVTTLIAARLEDEIKEAVAGINYSQEG